MRHALLALLLLSSAGATAAPVFQPGFHQALRWSVTTTGRTTYRMKLPVARGGDRLKVSFRAGSGGLQLYAASVALAGSNGALASDPLPLTFAGTRAKTLTAGQRVTSDPVSLPVQPGTELYVSFDVDGALAASMVDAFPQSYLRAGSYADVKTAIGGTAWLRAVGVDTVDVEGPLGRAFVAIGDSLTEGFSTDVNDYRDAWPVVAGASLGIPLVNAAVYGQTMSDCSSHFSTEVFTLQGITDCALLISSNDLGARPIADQLTRLASMYSTLKPFCRVWGGTLPPKEKYGVYDPVVVESQRQAINDWIRREASVDGVMDFDAVLRDPAAPSKYLAGLSWDHSHPNPDGYRLMGNEAADRIAPSLLALQTAAPLQGGSGGGTVVTVSGTGFQSGCTATFGTAAAAGVQLVDATTLKLTTPALGLGAFAVRVKNPDGQEAGGITFSTVAGPWVETLSPATIAPGGGAEVTLAGSGFDPGSVVTFGGTAAASTRYVSANELVVTAPALPVGSAEVVVTNPDGQVSQSARSITVRTSLKLSAIVPAEGPAGTRVTVTGEGIEPGARITFGGVDGQQLVIESDTRATVVTPPHPAGAVDVAVTNPEGELVLLAGGFDYQVPSPLPARRCGGAAFPLALLGMWRRRGKRRSVLGR